MVYAKGGTSQFSGGKGNVVKMNVYQEISQIIKEADGILIEPVMVCLSQRI